MAARSVAATAGDIRDEHGGRRGRNSTSEIYIRNMFDAWLGYMAQSKTKRAVAPQVLRRS